MYLLFFLIQSPLCFEITPFLYLETHAHQWSRKLGFFSSSHNGKGTSLRRGEVGFAVADQKPLISGFLVHCSKGTLRCGEVLCHGKGGFTVAKVASLRPTRSPLLVHLFFVSASVLFSYLFATRLIPLLPYSIEQDNIRD